MALMLGGKKESSPSSPTPGDGVKEAPGDDLVDELEDDETPVWSASVTEEVGDDADASPPTRLILLPTLPTLPTRP